MRCGSPPGTCTWGTGEEAVLGQHVHLPMSESCTAETSRKAGETEVTRRAREPNPRGGASLQWAGLEGWRQVPGEGRLHLLDCPEVLAS